MFSFRNPVQEEAEILRGVYVFTLISMEGDGDHYFEESIIYKGLDAIDPVAMNEIVVILKSLGQGYMFRDLCKDPEKIGVSKQTMDTISDMVGYDTSGNRHTLTEAFMTYYDVLGNKFNGDFYIGEEKVFPMILW